MSVLTCYWSLVHRLTYRLQPRTIEIERLLGLDKDVLEQGIAWPMIHVYDPADPHRVIKSWPIAEHYDPTPAFPVVSRISSLSKAITCGSDTIMTACR